MTTTATAILRKTSATLADMAKTYNINMRINGDKDVIEIGEVLMKAFEEIHEVTTSAVADMGELLNEYATGCFMPSDRAAITAPDAVEDVLWAAENKLEAMRETYGNYEERE